MKPAPLDYVRAGRVEQAAGALAAADGEGKIIAGGQSLMPMLALRLAQPAVLVDISRIPGLASIQPVGRGWAAGRRSHPAPRAGRAAQHRLLAEAARWIGHAAIQTRGTLGGSLAHADPAAALPVVAVAADAVALVAGPGGPRTIAAADLFTGALQTSLADDELIVAVDFPGLGRWGFAEFARPRPRPCWPRGHSVTRGSPQRPRVPAGRRVRGQQLRHLLIRSVRNIGSPHPGSVRPPLPRSELTKRSRRNYREMSE